MHIIENVLANADLAIVLLTCVGVSTSTVATLVRVKKSRRHRRNIERLKRAHFEMTGKHWPRSTGRRA